MESGINKYWKKLYEFDMCVRHDCHFATLDRAWDNYAGEFFLRLNIKELNLWI